MSQVRSAWPPARWARARLVLRNRASAPCADGQVAEGLGDVGFADADRAVEDDGFPGVQPAQGGQVADLGGGQLGAAAKSKPSRVACSSNRARREPAGQGHARAAGDLVLAEDLQEVQVAEFPGGGLGQAGVEGASMPDSFRSRSAPARALRSVVVTAVMRCCPPGRCWRRRGPGCPPMVPVALIWVQVPTVVQAGAGGADRGGQGGDRRDAGGRAAACGAPGW